MAKNKAHKRLLNNLKPDRYKLIIHPDFKDHTFRGEEVIFLTLKRPTKKIVLHSVNLKISDVYFKNLKTAQTSTLYDISYSVEQETITLNFARVCKKGQGELFLKFVGKLSDDMRGFYKSRYNHNGKEKFLATTQFESTDARRAFPCIDEPEAKAVFDVTMIVPRHHEAISNTMPIKIGEHLPAEASGQAGYKVVEFAPTPKMSTYLLAFISGEMESVEGKNKDGVLVRVFTTHGKKKQAEFALEVGKKSLEFYGKYFGIKYPLPVLDMIAIPDFASGAMENWGAVTYRESALLVDPDHTAAEDRQWVALVIAHELAHQWFGNLVTMKWWTDLWLNEGFASYIEYLAIDNIFPKWQIWKQFVSRELGIALRLDSLATTHPIEVPVNHPNEISEIFDAVSYSKGAVVIRMIAEYLGERDFQKGLSLYLKRHSYGNAETKDLWQALEEVSGKPVGKIMADWTKQSGYPILSVHKTGKGFEFNQSRFFMSPISRKSSKDKTLWNVPVIWQNKSRKVRRELFSKHFGRLNGFSGGKLNFGETSLIRVDYPESILKNIENLKLPAVDRLGLIRDSFALAESGQSPTTLALNLIESYKNEKEYVVWVEISGGLGRLAQVFSEESFSDRIKELRRLTFSPLAKKLGWNPKRGEPFTNAMLRDMALWEAGANGDKTIIDEAKKQFTLYIKKGKAPHKDIRGAVYLIIAKCGGKKEFAQLTKFYKEARLSDEKNRIGEALGAFNDKNLLNKALNFSLSKAVRPQDLFSIFRSVARNSKGRLLAWQFVRKNWQKFIKIYGAGGHIISKVIEPLGSISDRRVADEIEGFFKKQKSVGVERTVSQILELIRAKAEWRNRESKNIEKWLIERT